MINSAYFSPSLIKMSTKLFGGCINPCGSPEGASGQQMDEWEPSPQTPGNCSLVCHKTSAATRTLWTRGPLRSRAEVRTRHKSVKGNKITATRQATALLC